MSVKFDHIGVATKNLSDTLEFLDKTFSLKPSRIVETDNLKGAFIPVGDSEIELIQPLDDGLPIAQFISKKGEGVHHISLRVSNIEVVLDQLKNKGIKLMDEKPRIGIHGTKIAFLNPESTKGILIELCEGKSQ